MMIHCAVSLLQRIVFNNKDKNIIWVFGLE